MQSKRAKIAVVMGSESDLNNLRGGFSVLNDFKLDYVVRVISAHRTPSVAVHFAQTAKEEGIEVIICAAGMAAHLAGVIASHTITPVIGIPMACEPFNGLDALLATVQMPTGIPVATVTAGKAGAKNAALYAIQILALNDSDLADKLNEFRKMQTEKVIMADQNIMSKI